MIWLLCIAATVVLLA